MYLHADTEVIKVSVQKKNSGPSLVTKSQERDDRDGRNKGNTKIELSKAFYPCISTLEIALRKAIVRELQTHFGREDWYTQLSKTSGLANLNHYITSANKQISGCRELATPQNHC